MIVDVFLLQPMLCDSGHIYFIVEVMWWTFLSHEWCYYVWWITIFVIRLMEFCIICMLTWYYVFVGDILYFCLWFRFHYVLHEDDAKYYFEFLILSKKKILLVHSTCYITSYLPFLWNPLAATCLLSLFWYIGYHCSDKFESLS